MRWPRKNDSASIGARRQAMGISDGLVTSVGLPHTLDTDPEASRRFSAALASIGEPAMSRYTADDISSLLRSAGWTPDALIDPHDLDPGNPAGRSLLIQAPVA